MKLIATVAVFLLLQTVSYSSLLDPVIENVRHIKATHPPEKVSGMWKKKMIWKPRWIKEWKSSNVLKPIWRKFWGPVIIREWVPIPKPPPNWESGQNFVTGSSDPGPAPIRTPKSRPIGVGVPPSVVPPPPTPNQAFGPNPNTFTGYNYDPPKQTYDNKAASSYNNIGTGILNYQIPFLPISNNFNSQAETYKGQSSYGGGRDSSAYDLNPPVEQFDPKYSDYGPKLQYPQFGNDYSNIPVLTTTPHPNIHYHHPHHHHHHHHHPPHNHIHPSSQTIKFPSTLTSWKPMTSIQHSSAVHQASSTVPVVSPQHSTVPPEVTNLKPTSDDYIQQAALVGEYHYSEPFHGKPDLKNVAATPPPVQIPAFKPIQAASTTPVPVRVTTAKPPAPFHPPLAVRPHVPPVPAPHKTNPIQPRHPPSRYQNAIPPQKYLKPIVPATSPNKPKTPDFKALPSSSVQTFHFVEGLPSNKSLTKAALVGNVGLKTGAGSNQITIVTPKPYQKVAPHIAKLAEAVAEEHLKKMQKLNDITTTTTTEAVPTTTTERTRATVVLSTTSSSIKKTLRAYLADEANAAKTTNVYIVTPVPQKKIES